MLTGVGGGGGGGGGRVCAHVEHTQIAHAIDVSTVYYSTHCVFITACTVPTVCLLKYLQYLQHIQHPQNPTPPPFSPHHHHHSQSLVADIIRCCRYIRAPAAVDAALACIINMAASPDLLPMLLHQGALAFVIPLLFAYDVTHSTDDDLRVLEQQTTRGPGFLLAGIERTNQQDARNRHALLAARALGRLAGLLPAPLDTPVCEEIRGALGALLTEPLLPRLGEVDPRPLLADLNSSVATPQAVWNGSMRGELLKVMEGQQQGEVGWDAAHQFRCVVFFSKREEMGGGCVHAMHTAHAPTHRNTHTLPTPHPTHTQVQGSGWGARHRRRVCTRIR